jgi:hypothetical protein
MALVVVLLTLGAAAFQFLSILAFVLLSGFILTAAIVLNAFYLRSIDKLQDSDEARGVISGSPAQDPLRRKNGAIV